jgi:hypothetical protein
MNNRYKFQVWSPTKQRWRTAYCKPELLDQNVRNFMRFGFIVRYFP